MKRLLMFATVGLLLAQDPTPRPGKVVTVNTTTATVGTNDTTDSYCISTPQAADPMHNGIPTMHVECTVDGYGPVFVGDVRLLEQFSGALTLSFRRGPDAISYEVTKATPPTWKITANDAVGTGYFQ